MRCEKQSLLACSTGGLASRLGFPAKKFEISPLIFEVSLKTPFKALVNVFIEGSLQSSLQGSSKAPCL